MEWQKIQGSILAWVSGDFLIEQNQQDNFTLWRAGGKVKVSASLAFLQEFAENMNRSAQEAKLVELDFVWEGHSLLCNGYPVATIDQAQGAAMYFWSYCVGSLLDYGYGPHPMTRIKEIVKEHILREISPWAAILLGFEVSNADS